MPGEKYDFVLLVIGLLQKKPILLLGRRQARAPPCLLPPTCRLCCGLTCCANSPMLLGLAKQLSAHVTTAHTAIIDMCCLFASRQTSTVGLESLSPPPRQLDRGGKKYMVVEWVLGMGGGTERVSANASLRV